MLLCGPQGIRAADDFYRKRAGSELGLEAC